MLSDKTIKLLILCFISTIPLLYGARQPIVQGTYSGILLLVSGMVLIFKSSEYRINFSSLLCLYPALLLAYIFFSSFSLPLIFIDFFSSARADSLLAARNIAGVIEQQTAFSYYAPRSAFYAVYGLGLMLYFHIAVPTIRSKDFLRKLLWAITIIGSFEALYGLLQTMIPTLGVLALEDSHGQFRGTARGTIIYRNQYALLLNLCWPAATALGISLYAPVYAKYRSKLRRGRKISLSEKISIFADKAIIPLLCSAVMILALLFTQSRGGIITMSLAGFLFGYLLPISRKQKILIGLPLFIFLCFYGAMMGGYQDIVTRFSQFISGAEGRFTIWLGSLTMLKDHLYTGIGMGGYEFLSLMYLEGVSGNVWYDRAHNEYLELAIELGVPVVITLYIWLSAGVYHYFKFAVGIRKAKNKIRKMSLRELSALAAFCSLIAFLLHGFVDFVWRLPANVFFMVTLLAMLSSAQRSHAKERAK